MVLKLEVATCNTFNVLLALLSATTPPLPLCTSNLEKVDLWEWEKKEDGDTGGSLHHQFIASLGRVGKTPENLENHQHLMETMNHVD